MITTAILGKRACLCQEVVINLPPVNYSSNHPESGLRVGSQMKTFASLRRFLILFFCAASFALHGSSALAAKVKTHLQLGDEASDQGNDKKAIAEYSQEIKLNPEDAQAYYGRGLAYLSVGKGDLAERDFDKATKEYSEAIKANPNNAEAYRGRGMVYFLNRLHIDDAMHDFTKAVELNPEYASAYYGLGCVYQLNGKYDKAIDNFTKAIKLKPDYGEAYLTRGESFSGVGKYDQAINDLTMAIKFKKKYWLGGAYYARGQAYERKEDKKGAVKDFKKAVELEPNNAVYKSTLGVFLVEEKK